MQVDDEAFRRELDTLGEHQVRLRLAQGHYRDRKRLVAEEWLRQQAKNGPLHEPHQRASASLPLESLRLERRNDRIAIVAATAAVIAAIMAAIAATVSVLTYLRTP
jgi:hypothetical protein